MMQQTNQLNDLDVCGFELFAYQSCLWQKIKQIQTSSFYFVFLLYLIKFNWQSSFFLIS